MSDPTEAEDSKLRGDAAWKQQLADVEKRNTTASRDGKAKREAGEQARAARRQESEIKELARFISKQ